MEANIKKTLNYILKTTFMLKSSWHIRLWKDLVKNLNRYYYYEEFFSHEMSYDLWFRDFFYFQTV